MSNLEHCPEPLPKELDEALAYLADMWATHPARPRIRNDIATAWDRLLEEWIADPGMPLLVRKNPGGSSRGSIVLHHTGRELIPTDNSPASWSYLMAFDRKCPTLAEVRTAFEQDAIPIAMVLNKGEKAKAKFKCTRIQAGTPNDRGWKVCHKRAIGLHGRGALADWNTSALETHFKDFLAPSNMFLVPLELGGLGEVPHFVNAIARQPNGM